MARCPPRPGSRSSSELRDKDRLFLSSTTLRLSVASTSLRPQPSHSKLVLSSVAGCWTAACSAPASEVGVVVLPAPPLALEEMKLRSSSAVNSWFTNGCRKKSHIKLISSSPLPLSTYSSSRLQKIEHTEKPNFPLPGSNCTDCLLSASHHHDILFDFKTKLVRNVLCNVVRVKYLCMFL